jgi:nucleoside-diphosphate-sugar epimerase
LQEAGKVIATTRHPDSLEDLAAMGATIVPMDCIDPASVEQLRPLVPVGCKVLHSIPVVNTGRDTDPTPRLLAALADRPSRIVYLSTTGIYGRSLQVDHTTIVDARTERLRLRVAAEKAVSSVGYSWIVLRPAAIYGPWRGVHSGMREGKFRVSADDVNYISRIHVDDLANHTYAALISRVSGCYPVADLEPCPSSEVARFCAGLLQVPMPGPVPHDRLAESRRSNRRVDGAMIRRLLNVTLQYPTYREGIAAAIREEEQHGLVNPKMQAGTGRHLTG